MMNLDINPQKGVWVCSELQWKAGIKRQHLMVQAISFGFKNMSSSLNQPLLLIFLGQDQHEAGFGQDSSDENQSWGLAPSMTSDASLPSDFQDEGKSLTGI